MTFYFISVIIGIIISIMIAINGELTTFYGTYLATAIIHIVGLLCVSLLCMKKKEKLFFGRQFSFYLYIGGAIGVGTTVFNNFAYGKISVTAIIALGLLGQTITSLVIDQFGLFQMPKQKFSNSKLIGIVLVLIGIAVMLKDSEFLLVPIVLSLLSGVTIVTSRSVNACLSEKTSVLTSSWYNFAVGFLLSIILLITLSNQELQSLSLHSLPKLWWLLGGFLGVCVIALCNVAVSKISAFHMTLCLFVGQIFTGVALDILLTQTVSINNLTGGLFVALGLSSNLWLNSYKRAA